MKLTEKSWKQHVALIESMLPRREAQALLKVNRKRFEARQAAIERAKRRITSRALTEDDIDEGGKS